MELKKEVITRFQIHTEDREDVDILKYMASTTLARINASNYQDPQVICEEILKT